MIKLRSKWSFEAIINPRLSDRSSRSSTKYRTFDDVTVLSRSLTQSRFTSQRHVRNSQTDRQTEDLFSFIHVRISVNSTSNM